MTQPAGRDGAPGGGNRARLLENGEGFFAAASAKAP